MYGVIKEAIVTEKAKTLELQGWQCFFVDPKATKSDITSALETLYGAKVEAVRIVKVLEKTKSGKHGSVRRRAAAVKAYVKIDKQIAQLAKVK